MIRGGQLPQVILHDPEHQGEAAVGWQVGIEERQDLVDPRAVDLLVDPAADVADDPPVDLDDRRRRASRSKSHGWS